MDRLCALLSGGGNGSVHDFAAAVLAAMVDSTPGASGGAWLLRGTPLRAALSTRAAVPPTAAAALLPLFTDTAGPTLVTASQPAAARACRWALAPLLAGDAAGAFILLPAAGETAAGTLDLILTGNPGRGFAPPDPHTWEKWRTALHAAGPDSQPRLRAYLGVHEAIAALSSDPDPATRMDRVTAALGALLPGGWASFLPAGHDDAANGAPLLQVPLRDGDRMLGELHVHAARGSALPPLAERLVRTAGHHLEGVLARVEHQKSMQRTLLGTITVLANIVEEKDDYTGGHCQRLAELSLAVGIRLGLDRQRLDNLTYAAILHDIGKVAVPDGILNKPGPLTPDEYHILQQHSTVGGRLLLSMPFLRAAAPIVEQHHERWDGQGYPAGLLGEETLLEARILSVADAFDAMTSTRPYRRALPRSRALTALQEGAGTQFDPQIVSVFLQYLTQRSRTNGTPL